jgi:predicted nucleic acid-binding protein
MRTNIEIDDEAIPSVIVVDTSVWIDVLNEAETPEAGRCVELIEAGEPVALTDVIFTEILQGLRSEREARTVERHLRAFPILQLDGLDDFVLAAELYQSARRAGGDDSQDTRLLDRRAVRANRLDYGSSTGSRSAEPSSSQASSSPK